MKESEKLRHKHRDAKKRRVSWLRIDAVELGKLLDELNEAEVLVDDLKQQLAEAIADCENCEQPPGPIRVVVDGKEFK